MVNVAIKVQTPGQRMRERVERLNKIKVRPGIRVEPANDDMRRLLAHPKAGRFRSEGSMEWPDDTFTHRRLRDGDIKRAEKAKPKQPEAPKQPVPPKAAEPKHDEPKKAEPEKAEPKAEGAG